MTLPRHKQLDQNEIDSIKNAVEDLDIRAIHPDKMEDFAEYLVLKKQDNLNSVTRVLDLHPFLMYITIK